MITTKKVLFVIDSLGIGGAERSLINLLKIIDYSKLDVNLQLFNYGGAFIRDIPSEVNLLPELPLFKLLSNSKIALLKNPLLFFSKIIFYFKIRIGKEDNINNMISYWRIFSKFIKKTILFYDIAIAYSQGLPTMYVIDKVRAEKKYLWINTIFTIDSYSRNYLRRYYKESNGIIAVSEIAQDYFIHNCYPEYKEKVGVIRDIINPHFIKEEAQKNCVLKKNINTIITVGRLEKNFKGFDLVLHSAKILKKREIQFQWIIIGSGPFYKEMQKYIEENELSDSIFLIGATNNPYPYINKGDIYVQTSRFEGFCLTVAEAKILNKPVVITPFKAATLHVENGKNGLITTFDPIDIANKIHLLINDLALYNHIIENLKKEKKGNLEEIEKFYNLLKK